MKCLIYMINDIQLNATENIIKYKDKEIFIEPRLANLLCFLADNPNTVFSRQELIEQVWDGAVVTDQVVTQSVFECRKILTECDSHNIIHTIPKRGYKLDAVVTTQTEKRAPDYVSPPIVSITENEAEIVLSTVPFPSAPLTRAINQGSTINDATHSLYAKLKEIFVRHIFDIFMLVMLALIVGNILKYQASTHESIRFDSDIITITTSADKQVPIALTHLETGIANQIALNLQKYTNYFPRFSNLTPPAHSKILNINIERLDKHNILSISLFNPDTYHYLYQKKIAINEEQLPQIITETVSSLLTKLGSPLDNDELPDILTGMPVNNAEAMLYLLSQYYIEQSSADEVSNGVKLLDQILDNSPNNTNVLALRYIAYRKLLSENKQFNSVEANALLKQYGQQLYQLSQAKGLHTALFYDALALYAYSQGDIQMSYNALQQAKSIQHNRSALGYLILCQLNIKSHQEIANDLCQQAAYINDKVTI
ncbi:winged helix-turn-helix domain-containing protein [Shewanella marina]|uniref:winged helix-turn-helix domain-containing protein n=1 Tax=Shewanella marina TaxID=487319 RepID=UPI000472B403|nr:winged helix-turn-helix domain-containing protein [Shewanella marina]